MERFFDLFLLLGIISLVAGACIAASRRMGPRRWAFAAPALLVMPLTTGMALWESAAAVAPFSIVPGGWRWHPHLTLPMASEGSVNRRQHPRLAIDCDGSGRLFVESARSNFEEMEQRLAERPALPVLLRLDSRTPFRILGWILGAIRTSGRDEVLLHVRYPGGWDEPEFWPSDACVPRGYWPDREFALPLLPDQEGPTLLLWSRSDIRSLWGPLGSDAITETRIVAVYREAEMTTDTSAAERWIREQPPVRLWIHRKVPAKFIVALLSCMKRAGLALPALIEHEPSANELGQGPDEAARRADYLPYPSER